MSVNVGYFKRSTIWPQKSNDSTAALALEFVEMLLATPEFERAGCVLRLPGLAMEERKP